jgi:hypothetical protein
VFGMEEDSDEGDLGMELKGCEMGDGERLVQ